MLKAILSHQQRPRVGDLLRALENNPELAGDAAKKVVAGLHALKCSSTFVRFAVSRYMRAVRIVQLTARRMLAGNMAMRMRALQEWTKRQEHAWHTGIAAVRRPPSDAIRIRVISEEFAEQRRRFATVWRVWRKVQLSTMAQRHDVTTELHALTLRQGHSAAVVKHLQDRMAYLNSRLQHHESAQPQFRGMDVDLAVLEARVSEVMHKEAAERVCDAMGTIGVRAEDPAFLDAVVRRYEEALEQEYTRSRLARASWRRKSRLNLKSSSPTPPDERHRASIVLAQTTLVQPSLQVLIPQQPTTGATNLAVLDGGKTRCVVAPKGSIAPGRARLVRVDSLTTPSHGPIQSLSRHDSTSCNDASVAKPIDNALSSSQMGGSMGPAGAVRFLDEASTQQSLPSFRISRSFSILTPTHQQRFVASDVSRTTVAGEAPLSSGHSTAVSVQMPSLTAGTPATTNYTASAKACFRALGISLDSLSVPVEAPGCHKFAEYMRSALTGDGNRTADVHVAPSPDSRAIVPPPDSPRDDGDCVQPVDAVSRPRRIMIKQLPSVPPRVRASRTPVDISSPRLNHAAQLRRSSPLRARVLTSASTIAERFGGEESGGEECDAPTLTEEEKQAIRRDKKDSSKRKPPTQTNLQACRVAWRQQQAVVSGCISPRAPVHVPPVHRLQDMIAPSPPPDWMSPFGEEDEASAAQRQHNTIPHPRSASPLPTAAAALASTAQQEGLVVVNPHPVRTSHHATTQGHAALDAGDDAAALRHTNNIVVAPPHGGGRPASVHTCGAMTITSSGSLLVHGMAPKAFSAMQKPPAQQGAAAARASSSAKPSLLPVGSLPRLPRVVNTMCIITPNRLHPQQPAAAVAATPPSVSSSGIAVDTYLAVACSDGSLRVYSLVDMDTCVFADCPASREAINQIVVCQAYMCASCDDHCTYTYQFCGGDALAGSTCNSNGSAGGGSSWQRAHAQPQSSPHPPNRRHPTTTAGLARRASGVSHASPAVGGGLGGSNGSTAALWVPHGKQHHGTAITSIVAYVPRSDASPALTMQQQGPLSPQRRSHGGGALTSLPLATPALLLVTTYEPDVVIWDVAEGTVYARLQGHTQGVQHCFTSLTTGNIVTCSYDSTVRLWDLATPLQAAASGGEPTPPQATQERRGRSLQGSIGLDDELVADASDAHSLLCSRHYIEEGVHYGVTAFTHHRKAVLHAVDVAGTRSLCSISRDDTICVWDQLTLEPLCVVSHVPGHQFVACVPFPCLSSVAMLFGDGTCRVYSTTKGKQMYFMNIAIPQSVTRITRTGLLASCSTSGRISVISADTGEVVASDTKLHGLGITCVLPLYDDEGPDAALVAPLLITGSEDRMVRVSHIQRLGAGGQQRRSLGTAPIGVVNEAVQGSGANQVVVNAC